MRRSGILVMFELLKVMKRLTLVIAFTVIAGTLGYLSAIAITVFGVLGVLKFLGESVPFSYSELSLILVTSGVLRGFLRYVEHYSGHYIAFRLLATLRDRIFAKLRKLAPAKLDMKHKGDLVSMITADIETLEVFYAHTIAPIVIAFNVSLIMSVAIALLANVFAGLIALFSFAVVGIIFPLYFQKRLEKPGRIYRRELSDYAKDFLDARLGIKDAVLTDTVNQTIKEIGRKSDQLETSHFAIQREATKQRALTDVSIYLFIGLMGLITGSFYVSGYAGGDTLVSFIWPVIALFSSFGPVLALSALPANLNQTFSSANRVLDLLEEEPVTPDVTDGADERFARLRLDGLRFGYDDHEVLRGIDLELKDHGLIGIYGPSGSGKSTLLKLIMRFYATEDSMITINDRSINRIDTRALRREIGYVMQQTDLFFDSVYDNLDLNRSHRQKDVFTATKRTGIDAFIAALDQGYDTLIGDLGRNVSEGERQRIGLARALIHDSKVILLDEPTSNVDIMNESIILKTLVEESRNKLIILVSHKRSTLSVCDEVYALDQGTLRRT
ncbi:MAG: amino acid ABC transporter ATP-binding/permease protein [Acholeplasmataceae bacterium]